MKANKQQNEKMKAYILSCIDTSLYPEMNIDKMSDLEKLNFVWGLYQDQACYPQNLKRIPNEQARFADWLQGLPSSFNIDFENYEILRIGREFGFLPDQTSQEVENQKRLFKRIEKKEDDFLAQWWGRIYVYFNGMRRELTKKAK
jgi:hypothetical protein